MLKKKERLTRKEFDRSFSIGKRIHGPNIQLIYAQSPSFHCSVVVGKKVYKKAVDRNRLRRRIYALVYHYHKTHTLDQTCILIAKPTVKTLTAPLLKEEVTSLLEKVPSVHQGK